MIRNFKNFGFSLLKLALCFQHLVQFFWKYQKTGAWTSKGNKYWNLIFWPILFYYNAKSFSTQQFEKSLWIIFQCGRVKYKELLICNALRLALSTIGLSNFQNRSLLFYGGLHYIFFLIIWKCLYNCSIFIV